MSPRTTGIEEGDAVNHPDHYNSHPSGVECIDIIRHHNLDIGTAIKYLWRTGLKVLPGQDARDQEIEDLEKAVFYINDEIARLRAIKSMTMTASSGWSVPVPDGDPYRIMPTETQP